MAFHAGKSNTLIRFMRGKPGSADFYIPRRHTFIYCNVSKRFLDNTYIATGEKSWGVLNKHVGPSLGPPRYNYSPRKDQSTIFLFI